MIKTTTEIELFKLFTNSGVSNHVLFNDICDLIGKKEYQARGHCDSEHYDTLVKLINLENNSGWDSKEKHSKKIEIINSATDNIVERSESFLP